MEASTHRRPGLAVPLAEVTDFRRAARMILRDAGLTRSDREGALERLYERAKAEPLARFAIGAIVAEILWSIDRPDVAAQRLVGDRLERRHRALRAEGFDRCPRCLTALSAAADWSYWAALRDDAAREASAREGAA